MLITVVIPTFNRSRQLKRALQSLECQTFKEFEVIVVDDGSTENIINAVTPYEELIDVRVIRIVNSGSPAKPRNVGINNARSEWVAFLDSDDWWTNDKLMVVSNFLNNKVDLVYHKLRHADDTGGEIIPCIEIGEYFNDNLLAHLLIYGNCIPNSSAVIRRSALFDVQGVCEERPLIEDYDLFIRLAANKARSVFVEKTLGYYCVEGDNISRPSISNALALENVFKRTACLIENSSVARQSKSFYEYSVGLKYSRSGYYNFALPYYVRSIRSFTFHFKVRAIVRLASCLLCILLRRGGG